jgi:hypothetical protein
VRETDPTLLLHSQSTRCSHNVLDLELGVSLGKRKIWHRCPHLPAIELAIYQNFQLRNADIRWSLRCIRIPNKQFPALLPRILGQVAISQHDVDPAEDGWIELRNSVCGEELKILRDLDFE